MVFGIPPFQSVSLSPGNLHTEVFAWLHWQHWKRLLPTDNFSSKIFFYCYTYRASLPHFVYLQDFFLRLVLYYCWSSKMERRQRGTPSLFGSEILLFCEESWVTHLKQKVMVINSQNRCESGIYTLQCMHHNRNTIWTLADMACAPNLVATAVHKRNKVFPSLCR